MKMGLKNTKYFEDEKNGMNEWILEGVERMMNYSLCKFN